MPNPLLASIHAPLMAIVLALAPVAMSEARASGFSASAGASVTASDDWSGTVFLDAAGTERRFRRLDWQPVSSLGWIGARERSRPGLDRDVAIVATGVRINSPARRAFFAFQLGLASRKTPAISSHGQFVSTLGIEGRRSLVMVRHISNGRLLGGENLGETMLLVGWRF